MSCGEKSVDPTSNHGTGFSTSTGVSFKFQKKKPAPIIAGPATGDRPEEKDFVTSLEDREIQSSKGKVVDKEHIVPLIKKNVWRQPGAKRPYDSCTESTQKSEEEAALDREAAEAIMKDVETSMQRVKNGSSGESMVIPLLLQNKPPVMPGKEEDELADIELRPDESTAEEYEAMPIEKFGEAVLKGMGWIKGQAIGKTNKGLIEPIEFLSRPRGLGLGAAPKAVEEKKRIKKPGEEEKPKVSGPYVGKDGRMKHVKTLGEEIPPPPVQGFVVGNVAKVLKGPHADLCGKIVGLDEDNARVFLKMAINGQTLMFSRHTLVLLEESKEEGGGSSAPDKREEPRTAEKKYGLIRRGELDSVAKATTARDHVKGRSDVSSKNSPSEEQSYDGECSTKFPKLDQGHTSHHTDVRHKAKGTPREKKKETYWVSPNQRVRIVDRAYKKGQYYNTKVVIVDVVSMGTCVCQTDEGKLLEDVHQSMLETIVPKEPRSVVQVLVGSNKGQLGTILDRNRQKNIVTVEMALSKEVLTLGFDDVCEHISTEFD